MTLRRPPRLAVPPVIALALLLAAGCQPAPLEQPACPAGETRCSGICVDLATSAQNCGQCENHCLAHATCAAGVCSACPADRPDACVQAGQICTNLQTGVDGYCGACGVTCQGPGVNAADATCATGSCVCSGAASDCGGNPRCVNTQTDAQSCGGCGTVCASGRTCDAGQCVCPASAPTTCGTGTGTCTNTSTDPQNCGTCGHVCSVAGQVCASGTCACPSSAPATCGARCADLQNDRNNCGGCGNVCPSGQVCVSGRCGCDASTPLLCGTTCCAGTFCCGGGNTCAIARSNGLGQTFFTCDPPGTWSLRSAEEAATAWEPSPTSTGPIFCDVSCLGWQRANACAVWCYQGNFAGQVTLNTIGINCLCPPQGSPKSW